MIALLANVFDTVINWARSLSPSIRGIIIMVALILCFFLLARSINVGKNHTDRPIKWVCFGFSIIFFAVAIFFAVFY